MLQGVGLLGAAAMAIRERRKRPFYCCLRGLEKRDDKQTSVNPPPVCRNSRVFDGSIV